MNEHVDRLPRERLTEAIRSVRIRPVLDPTVTAMIQAGAGFHLKDKETQGLADAVLAALAGDPGDLPTRMAEAIRSAAHMCEGEGCRCDDDEPIRGTLGRAEYIVEVEATPEDLAGVAMSVRWEDHAATVARLAQAEAERDHTEGQLSALRDHRAHWETERAEVERIQAELAVVKRNWTHLSESLAKARKEIAGRKEHGETLEAERDLLRETLAESDLGALTLAQWEAIAAADADRDRLEAERDALKAAIEEQIPRTLNAAADKLHALPATDGAALKGPYWYRQGFTQAADLLRDWADYPAALAAPEATPDAPKGGEDSDGA